MAPLDGIGHLGEALLTPQPPE
ncbi:MAG: hypothetical protein RLZZ106_1116, partial [Cyanobacteriota bacterium]